MRRLEHVFSAQRKAVEAAIKLANDSGKDGKPAVVLFQKTKADFQKVWTYGESAYCRASSICASAKRRRSRKKERTVGIADLTILIVGSLAMAPLNSARRAKRILLELLTSRVCCVPLPTAMGTSSAAFSAGFWRSRRGPVATSAAACERRRWPRRATSDWCSSPAAQASFAVPGRE
jgi:hypothetical protein